MTRIMATALERARKANAAKGLPPIDPSKAKAVGEILSRNSTAKPVELTPRVNSGNLPEPSETEIDRERLLERLSEFALRPRPIIGDGACQFRAISDQLYGSEDFHAEVRTRCVEQLFLHPERYKSFVESTDYDEYIQKMRTEGEWGDHVTLQALADSLGQDIHLITSFASGALVVVKSRPPDEERLLQMQADPKPPLWLSFWAEIHYESVEPNLP